MKFLFAFVAIVAVAAATQKNEMAQLEAVIAAIQSPSTDPATAALLEQQLLEVLGIDNTVVAGGPIVASPAVVANPGVSVVDIAPALVPAPIAGGIDIAPALVEAPIAGGIDISPAFVEAPIAGGIDIAPAFVDFPTEVDASPAVVAPAVVSPVPTEVPVGPLVQIILNINSEGLSATPVAAAAAAATDAAPAAPAAPIETVNVVDFSEPIETVNVVNFNPQSPRH